MNKMTILDNRTGELLSNEYDSNSHKYSINGIEVIRQAPLESSDDELVFSSSDGNSQKLLHILEKEIKNLWKE